MGCQGELTEVYERCRQINSPTKNWGGNKGIAVVTLLEEVSELECFSQQHER